MKQNYTEQEFKEILSKIEPRASWDFSRMNTISETAPWDYVEVVKQHLKPIDKVLDIGTGGGERFTQLAQYFRSGIGIDVDPVMVKTANENTSTVANLSFIYSDEDIQELPHDFDVILNRHAPFSLEAVKEHLKGDGQFITQQVGEQNMLNVKKALNLPIVQPPIDRVMLSANGLKIIDFREYNIEYIVKDIESLVFWLNALDMLHADIEGSAALKDVDTHSTEFYEEMLRKEVLLQTNSAIWLLFKNRLKRKNKRPPSNYRSCNSFHIAPPQIDPNSTSEPKNRFVWFFFCYSDRYATRRRIGGSFKGCG